MMEIVMATWGWMLRGRDWIDGDRKEVGVRKSLDMKFHFPEEKKKNQTSSKSIKSALICCDHMNQSFSLTYTCQGETTESL